MLSNRKVRGLVALSAFAGAVLVSRFAAAQSTAQAGPLRAVDGGKAVAVTIDGEPFASLHHKGFAKPIVYPILGPGGVRMVRHFPMKKGVEGEKPDHPHHQSLWFTHGEVNGVSFWHLGKDAGRIVCTKAQVNNSRSHSTNDGTSHFVGVALQNEWRKADGTIVCTDEQQIDFVLLPGGDRAIDYAVTIKATHGDVTFGDTKEGTAGIRTHPGLRIDKGAKARNNGGVEGGAIWGKRAKWVDYFATVDGKDVGVAIFDHPTNPRHPTWWHARAYGLVAANPFGVHNFERKPKGTGDLVIKKGTKQSFRYRFLFYAGHGTAAKTEAAYAAGVKTTVKLPRK